MRVWKFPVQEDVVMNFLEDELDTKRVWVGSWQPPQDACEEFEAVVVVENTGHTTEDDTRYATVDIEVESDQRAISKRLAFEIAGLLNDLPGRAVRGVLVDDVDEVEGPGYMTNVDKSRRTYVMTYTLAFRKQFLEEE